MRPDPWRMAGCALCVISAAMFAGVLMVVAWAVAPSIGEALR